MGRAKKRKQEKTRQESMQGASLNVAGLSRGAKWRRRGTIFIVATLVPLLVLPLLLVRGPSRPITGSLVSQTGARTIKREIVPDAEDFRLTIPNMHATPVIDMAFSLDGNYLASLGSQNDIKVWDIHERTLIADIFYAEDNEINCLTFGPIRGTDWALAAGLESGSVLYIDREWNITSRVEMQKGAPVRKLLLTGDQKQLISIGDYRWTSLSLQDESYFDSELVFEDDHICSGPADEAVGDSLQGSTFGYRTWAVAPDSQLLALGCATLNRVPNRLSTIVNEDRYFKRGRSAIMSPHEKEGVDGFKPYEACNPPFLYRCDDNELGQGIDPFDPKLIDLISFPYLCKELLMQVRIAETGQEAQLEMALDGEWPAFDKRRLRSVLGLAFAPGGRYLASGHDDRYVRIWESEPKSAYRRLVARELFKEPVSAVAFSPNGKKLAALELGEENLRLHILATHTFSKPLQVNVILGGTKRVGEFIADIPEALVVDQPPGLTRLNTLPLPEVEQRAFSSGHQSLIRWIAGGKAVLVWSERTGTVFLANLATQDVRSFGRGDSEGMQGTVTSIAVSQSSPYFAFGTDTGEIFLRHQEKPYEPISLIADSILGSVLMPEECDFPPPWIYSPNGTLTLRSALKDIELLGDTTTNSWQTVVGQKKVFVVTGNGKVFIVDPRGATPPKAVSSPLGSFGPSLSIIGGNKLEYLLMRTYRVQIANESGVEYKAWKEREADIVKIPSTGAVVNTMACDRANKLILSGGTTNSVFAMDMSSGTFTKLLDYKKGANCRFELAADAGILLAWWCEDTLPSGTTRRLLNGAKPTGLATQIVAIDLTTLRPINRWKLPGLCSSLSIARDGSTIAGVWLSEVKVFGVNDNAPKKVLPLVARVQVPLLRDPFAEKHEWKDVESHHWLFPEVVVSANGERLYFYDESENFIYFNLKSDNWKGRQIVIKSQVVIKPPWHAGRALVSRSGRWMALSGYGRNLRLVDTETGTMRLLPGHFGFAYPSCFSRDEKFLVTSGDERNLRVWEVATGELKLEFRMFGQRDWVARTPDGRWAGTRLGVERARLVSGTWQGHFLGSSANWRSGLVEQVLSGRDDPVGDRKSFSRKSAESPSVTINSHERTAPGRVTLQVQVTGNGEPPTGLLVFVNGKLVENRGISMGSRETRQVTVTGIPLGAAVNHIQVIAGTAARAPSASSDLRIARRDAPEPVLHVISIGVNGPDLAYAQSDARAISSFLRAQPKSLYRDVRLVELYGVQATKQRIREAIAEIARAAQPQDAFIFYFAGHGAVFQPVGSRREACLLPTDALGRAPTTQSAISIADLRRWMIDCAAQQQLWIFDACGSGTLSAGLEELAYSESIERLAFDVGCNIIAATQVLGSELAQERNGVRGGVLTFALLEQLHSQPGASKRLGQIRDSLKARVRELTDRAQDPTVHLASGQQPFVLQAP